MIELRLTISEVDYDAVLQALAGHMTGPAALAVAAVRSVPDSAKEELAVRYMNANAGHISRQIENAAQSQGIRIRISDAQAAVLHP